MTRLAWGEMQTDPPVHFTVLHDGSWRCHRCGTEYPPTRSVAAHINAGHTDVKHNWPPGGNRGPVMTQLVACPGPPVEPGRRWNRAALLRGTSMDRHPAGRGKAR